MDSLLNSAYRKSLFISSLVLFITFLGCEKDSDEPDYEPKPEYVRLNEDIYDLMEDIYLWNDSLPEADPEAYEDPSDFLKSIRSQSIDKWSYIITTTQFNQYFQQGEHKGHGFSISLDEENNIRIGFLYKNTQAYQKGVRRSWIMKKVNGTDVTAENVNELLGSREAAITNTILFIDKEGNEQELELTKETIKINAVLHSEIIEQGAKKIGYVVFEDFISTANEELQAVFEEFASESIDELIVDLRYNGGGYNSVAEYFASWIAGDKPGEVFYKLLFNKNNEARNETVKFPANTNALDVGRVFFITTKSSASASELLINGLKPYYDVKLVGSNTAGKPVGMLVMNMNRYNYTLVPISFKYVNALDEGDFYDGLIVDYLADDDLTHDFGDPEENSLKTALSVINGEAMTKSAIKPSGSRVLLPSEEGINLFLRAY